MLRIIDAVLAVVVAVGTIVWIYRVCDSGTKSGWQGEVCGSADAPAGGEDND